MRVPRWLRKLDDWAIDLTRRYGLVVLRISLGIVFIWFGALKLFGVSPVADLVTATLFWLPPTVALATLGALEVVVGAGLVSGWAIRLTLPFFFAQMMGTFLVFAIVPERAFEAGNPLLLTQEGEFVLKNLVLVTAGLAIAGTLPRTTPSQPLTRMLTEKPADPTGVR